jgi:hypothetical protein
LAIRVGTYEEASRLLKLVILPPRFWAKLTIFVQWVCILIAHQTGQSNLKENSGNFGANSENIESPKIESRALSKIEPPVIEICMSAKCFNILLINSRVNIHSVLCYHRRISNANPLKWKKPNPFPEHSVRRRPPGLNTQARAGSRETSAVQGFSLHSQGGPVSRQMSESIQDVSTSYNVDLSLSL